ncbi:MAG: hypothetical protein H3C27_02185 [Opitutaceae bacterium]|nr:hypothetical protein [Opitutaceae bacterium]
MMRQDYILRLIGELRQFVAAVLGSGDPARAGEALHAILHAQQRLFQVPTAQFLGLTLDQQLDLLGRAEAPAHAVEKAATYAATLIEAARVYDATHRDDLAAGSRQLALAVLLTAAQRWPGQRDQLAAEVAQLRTALPAESLHPPVRELLRTWDDAP